MPSPQRDARREAAEERLKETLRTQHFGIRNCGLRKDDSILNNISPATGYWQDLSYASKATRWLIHLVERPDGRLGAELPQQRNSDRLGFFNTANTSIACVTIRVVPVARIDAQAYARCDDWQWLLWLLFSPPLPNSNSSVALDGYEPASGSIRFGTRAQRYAGAGLVALCDATAKLPANSPALPAAIANATYADATQAVASFLQIDPTVTLP